MSARLDSVEAVPLGSEPLSLLAKADYVAIADAERPGMHVRMECGDVLVGDDAQMFTLWCDRSAFPKTQDRVFKMRADIRLPDGSWQLLCSFTAAGGEFRNADGYVAQTSSATVGLPPGKGRVVRVSAVALKDVNTEAGVATGFEIGLGAQAVDARLV